MRQQRGGAQSTYPQSASRALVANGALSRRHRSALVQRCNGRNNHAWQVSNISIGWKTCSRAPSASRLVCPRGLVCDSSGQVVSATGANLFVQRRGKLFTPPLAGIGYRGRLPGLVVVTHERGNPRVVSGLEVLRADAVFLSNCVRGIVPVKRIEHTPVSGDAFAGRT
jgi:hypothetical protein